MPSELPSFTIERGAIICVSWCCFVNFFVACLMSEVTCDEVGLELVYEQKRVHGDDER
jgi:hypothetical protein